MMNRAGGAVFAPRMWVMPHPGTNGYVSSWGAMLSGTTPIADAAVPRPPAGLFGA